MSTTHKVTVEITDQDLKDLIITAVEGGFTSSWALCRHYNYQAGTVEIAEQYPGKDKRRQWHKVTTATIARGLRRAALAKRDEGGWAFGKWLTDRIGDAIIADVILQFGVLNEVKWG